MDISLQGFNNKYATMRVNDGTAVGNSIDIVRENTVSKAKDDRDIVGKLVSLNGVYGLIQTTGLMEFRYTGKKPELGYTGICADGYGGIKASDTGRRAIITSINEREKIVTIIL